MYVRDFSTYYDFPTGHNRTDEIVVGYWEDALAGGPAANPPNHTWAEGELLPEHLVGVPLASLSASQRSTYKVVRAVSEVECRGFFDCLNCFDNAIVSQGPCHWTLGLTTSGNVGNGELCGFLAYLHHADSAAFSKAFEFFGASIEDDWVHSSGAANGRPLFASGIRTYGSWVTRQQEDSSFQLVPRNTGEAHYYKGWHWVYRFAMAGRTIAGYRRRMWHLARVRIRDILDAPWGTGVTDVGHGTDAARPAKIGDVFTSEKAVAIIFRWHIKYPSNMLQSGRAAALLRNAYTRGKTTATTLNWNTDPATWTNAHETALIQGLRAGVTATGESGLQQTVNNVVNFPTWAGGANPHGYTLAATIGGLSETRNSFDFDRSDLPPAPYT
jgi:hypothetical protein